ncbi:MAG: hypothetical protein PUF69_04960 [Eubacteriales bacterium]|nr:hypothetical protein [Eubacteriales bacterium]
MKAYKGFNNKLQCREFQYKVGETYEEEKAELCSCGFHACEAPLDVFGYYPPADSRYCEVELEDVSEKTSEDSKRCARKISIGAEIGIKGIVEAGVKFIMDKVDWNGAKGSNTGDGSAATNTGDRSAATNTGYRSAAIVEGKESIAIATGIEGKAKGALGCFIVLAEWCEDENHEWHIKHVKSAVVDGETIKANTFYMLKDGEFTEVE